VPLHAAISTVAACPKPFTLQAQYQKTVIELAFLVACLYTAVGLFRLGFLIRFLSHPVITGFTSGAALVIAAGQVRHFSGCATGTGIVHGLACVHHYSAMIARTDANVIAAGHVCVSG
jgi:MFS superfamily sulfate permease-like transporter